SLWRYVMSLPSGEKLTPRGTCKPGSGKRAMRAKSMALASGPRMSGAWGAGSCFMGAVAGVAPEGGAEGGAVMSAQPPAASRAAQAIAIAAWLLDMGPPS